jgi:RNA polymerase sigma factor (sigma-70 family)
LNPKIGVEYGSQAGAGLTGQLRPGQQGMSALGASQPELSRTEAHLVDAARGGDERAFGELYERYGRGIFAYVLGMVRDHSRAEDIVQDVFVSALRRMRSSDQAISFKPWIYEIAKNACIDEFRRVRRSREVPIEHGGEERLLSAAPSPDTCFERGQQLATLHGAFRGLSARQHTVMVLRELEGLTYAEIAARTEMSVSMVESTLLRARRRLGEEYDDIASGRRCQQVHAVVDAGGQAAVNALGVRERRRFARHVAHCQPCALYVHTAGVAAPETGLPAVAKKIAGLLPFPIARWSWPWGSHARSGSHASGLMRSARRAAQVAHPSASVGATPATVATMAAVVIAGGGAAVGLLTPGQAAPTHRGPATISARPTAATRAVRPAPPRRVSRPLGSVSRTSGPSSSATRSGTSRTTHGAANTSSASTPAGAAPTQSSVPTSQSSSPSTPSTQLPIPVPASPLPGAKPLLHSVTSPLQKVVKQLPSPLPKAVKKLPGVVPKLPLPVPPGGLGLPKTLGGAPKTLDALPKTLGGDSGL